MKTKTADPLRVFLGWVCIGGFLVVLAFALTLLTGCTDRDHKTWRWIGLPAEAECTWRCDSHDCAVCTSDGHLYTCIKQPEGNMLCGLTPSTIPAEK